MGREYCANQYHQKPVEAVASLNIKISCSTLSEYEHKEFKMKEIRPIRSTGVSRKITASVKAIVIIFIAAVSLAMMAVGDDSA